MPLPLNLAMTPLEIETAPVLPAEIAWMSCHFDANGQGLSDIPDQLPENSLVILDDSVPCRGHVAGMVTEILQDLVSHFRCCGLLLDFQRPANEDSATIASHLVAALPCSVAVPPEYAPALDCPVFLPPAPLHIPLRKYLRSWSGREIWLEAALEQALITVTKNGTVFDSCIDPLPYGGFYSEKLCCQYVTNIHNDRISFTLFDTGETLKKKLELAHSLGVTRAIGLWQELGSD